MKYKNIELTDWQEGSNFLIRRVNNEPKYNKGNTVGYFLDHTGKFWVPPFAYGSILRIIGDLYWQIYFDKEENKFVRGKEDQQAKEFMDKFLLQIENLEAFI